MAAGAGLAIALFSGLFWLLWWRAKWSPEVREHVAALREALNEASVGGRSTGHFLDAEAKPHEQALVDLMPRLNDRKLRRRVQVFVEAYNDAWAAAPPMEPLVSLGGPQTPADIDRRRRYSEAAEAATTAATKAVPVFARLNRVERLLVVKR